MNRVVIGVCCCLLIVASAGVVATAPSTATATYSVSIPGSIDTPDRTVNVEGSTYTVSSIARVSKGATVTVQTAGPNNDSYRVYIHAVEDGSRTVYDTKFVPADGSGAITLNTTAYDPGSYVVSIYHDGTFYAPQPLVIPAYTTTLDEPGTVRPNGETNLSVSLTQTVTGHTVDSVEIVVANTETTRRLTATKNDGKYVATLSLNDLAAGEYNVHAVVYSPEPAPGGENEVIGVSDAATLTVESTTQTTTTTQNSGGGDSNPATTTPPTSTQPPTTQPQPSTQPPTTQSQPSTQPPTTQPRTSTPEPEPTTPPSTPQTTATTALGTTPTSTNQPTADTAESTTTDAVITPNQTPPQTTPTSNGVAGGTPPLLIAVLAAIALVIRTHRHS